MRRTLAVLVLLLSSLLLTGCDSEPLGVSVQNETDNPVRVSIDDGEYVFEVDPRTTRKILLDVNYDPQRVVVEEQSNPPRRFTLEFEISDFGDARIVVE
jgi:hypothetical protein